MQREDGELWGAAEEEAHGLLVDRLLMKSTFPRSGHLKLFHPSRTDRELFGQAARDKLQVQAPDGILVFDSAEQEYETDTFRPEKDTTTIVS